MWLTEDGDYIDTVVHPGQPGIPVVMEEVFKSFTTADGRQVPDLHTPAAGLSIDDEVRGGCPVVADSDPVRHRREPCRGRSWRRRHHRPVPIRQRRRNPRGDRACRASRPGRALDSMKVLLDEDVPQPWVRLVEHLLERHEVRHVSQLDWSGKKDVPLVSDAARRGFDAFVTQNIGQFNDPAECDAIKRSGMHHISYEMPPTGVRGLGLASPVRSAPPSSPSLPMLESLDQAAHREDHIARQESQALQRH